MKTVERKAASAPAALALTAVQAALAFVASWLAFWLNGGPQRSVPMSAVLVLTALFTLGLVALGAARANSHGWDAGDLASILLAALTGAAVGVALWLFAPPALGLEPVPIVTAASLIVVFNAVIRYYSKSLLRKPAGGRAAGAQPAIVVGTGKAAASIVRLIQESNFRYSVVGCVDDEVLSSRVANKPVLGSIDDLPALIRQHRIACVIIAIPSASEQLVKRVVTACVNAVGSEDKPPAVKVLPGLLELLSAKDSRVRTVQPEYLLPRHPVTVDLSEIAPHVENRVILVTGAGGSIGSELCRQIVGLNPSMLLLLGHGENSLFDIEDELKVEFGFNRTKIVLADVADAARIRHVFSQYHPHVVFHSAAHKHVPIVELNVCEAVRNNIMGTHVVALAAAAVGAAKFVLLSTDKAVNPASVMGATKRVAELITQSFQDQTGTEFVTVRFGNVLESRGSVIPIFKRQIEQGGPITITHRDMQRYFMTIPEAVSLVMLAMAIGRDGQVLVLDMGKPVKIIELAETLITLSGLTPYRDIGIVETGIRPGEKLYEEILTSYEGLSTTSHARLLTARQERVAYDTLALALRELEACVRTGDQAAVLSVLQNLVPSFAPGQHLLGEKPAGARGETPPEQLTSAAGHAAPEGNGHPETLVVAEVTIARPKEGSQPAGASGGNWSMMQ